MASELEPQSVYKLVLLGASDVGKSSLVLRFVKNKFFDKRENTIGAAFLTKTLKIDDNVIKFEIWDTAGQERYHSLAPMYYRDAEASIVVYDITNNESFGKAKRWLSELYKAGNKQMSIALVGNKQDLDTQREVEYSEGEKYAKEQDLLFAETSAKTNYNVAELFEALGKHLIELHPPEVNPFTANDQNKQKSSFQLAMEDDVQEDNNNQDDDCKC
eukprot:TRINITY_DN7672_c2_g1_i1.p1 TRINITY_DN7672_c2_g1~~TRINITY_DN7672_c2_g1_i1.p1  ORF type:complete len:224 (+),score=59.37 TRINITY_DN7672_c2_g1_i1:25-672(+)